MAVLFPITSSMDLYPKTHIPHTYPEEGHHLHHIPLPYMAYSLSTKIYDKDDTVHQPRTDVRETLRNFYLEVELPGVKEHSALRLRWTNERTLLLTSKTSRLEIPEEELEDGPVPLAPAAEVYVPAPETSTESAPQTEQLQAVPNPPAPSPLQPPKTHEPHLTFHERLIGELIRAYSFPVDVDRENAHAKLDAGILSVVVPKIVHAAAEGAEERHFLHVPIKILNRENSTPAHQSS